MKMSLLAWAVCLSIISLTGTFAQNQNRFRIVEGNKVGYMNASGQIVIRPRFFNALEFTDGLAAVRENGFYGYIDTSGNYVIPPMYDKAGHFWQGLAGVYKDGELQFIDRNNKVALPGKYRSLNLIGTDKAVAYTRKKKATIIELDGTRITRSKYNGVGRFEKGVAVATIKKGKKEYGNTLYCVIDTMGNEIVPFGTYASISEFFNGYAVVGILDDKKQHTADGVIDTKGNLLFVRQQKDGNGISGSFCEGLTTVAMYKDGPKDDEGKETQKRYHGYINLKGEIVCNDTDIDDAGSFSYGRAIVRTFDRKYRIIDRNMKMLDSTFDEVPSFAFLYPHTPVRKNDKWGIIDTNGNFVIPAVYDNELQMEASGRYFFFNTDSAGSDQKHWGMADLSGRVIMPTIMSSFSSDGFVSGIMMVGIDGKLCYVDTNGKIVWHENDAEPGLFTVNVDYMVRGYFRVFRSSMHPDPAPVTSRWRRAYNVSQQAKGDFYPKGELSVYIDDKDHDTFSQVYKGYAVYIVNATSDTVRFSAQDCRLYMKVQALNTRNKWKDIEFLPSSWCGNSYHTLELVAGNYWSFTMPKYEGALPTKLRVELTYIADMSKKKKKMVYSNEITASVNPAQFWNKPQYRPRGLMDPYNE